MTREMNKPEYCTFSGECLRQTISIDLCSECSYRKKELDEWIKPFFEHCCKMERLK